VRVAPVVSGDHRLRERLRGTFAPLARASESPMAMACLRLVTFRPPRVVRDPRFRRRMALLTIDPALVPYFRRLADFLRPVLARLLVRLLMRLLVRAVVRLVVRLAVRFVVRLAVRRRAPERAVVRARFRVDVVRFRPVLRDDFRALFRVLVRAAMRTSPER